MDREKRYADDCGEMRESKRIKEERFIDLSKDEEDFSLDGAQSSNFLPHKLRDELVKIQARMEKRHDEQSRDSQLLEQILVEMRQRGWCGADQTKMDVEEFQEENEAIFDYNQHAMRYNGKCNSMTPLHVLRKATTGEGAGIRARTTPWSRQLALPEVCLGDTVPRSNWPYDYDELQTWDIDQIDALSRILDVDFDIIESDSLVDCRQKVRAYISGHSKVSNTMK